MAPHGLESAADLNAKWQQSRAELQACLLYGAWADNVAHQREHWAAKWEIAGLCSTVGRAVVEQVHAAELSAFQSLPRAINNGHVAEVRLAHKKLRQELHSEKQFVAQCVEEQEDHRRRSLRHLRLKVGHARERLEAERARVSIERRERARRDQARWELVQEMATRQSAAVHSECTRVAAQLDAEIRRPLRPFRHFGVQAFAGQEDRSLATSEEEYPDDFPSDKSSEEPMHNEASSSRGGSAQTSLASASSKSTSSSDVALPREQTLMARNSIDTTRAREASSSRSASEISGGSPQTSLSLASSEGTSSSDIAIPMQQTVMDRSSIDAIRARKASSPKNAVGGPSPGTSIAEDSDLVASPSRSHSCADPLSSVGSASSRS